MKNISLSNIPEFGFKNITDNTISLSSYDSTKLNLIRTVTMEHKHKIYC